jgi:hypothetical protein
MHADDVKLELYRMMSFTYIFGGAPLCLGFGVYNSHNSKQLANERRKSNTELQPLRHKTFPIHLTSQPLNNITFLSQQQLNKTN